MASFFTTELQITSDLHLETPIIQPSYLTYKMNIKASNLCLLGDFGLVSQPGLFVFLENLLKSTPNLKIFYVLGNHEPYRTTLSLAKQQMRAFEKKMSWLYGNRFIFLDRTRHNISATITVLGCTLWSHIIPEEAAELAQRLTDYNELRGIRDWGIEDHNAEHREDLDWLNSEVTKIQSEEPHRQIIILTHHSPTNDKRANSPRHIGSSINSGFVTDLSKEPCWKSPQVKLWAFGHTHYSFSYHE
ncbi:hypothetical protein K402DRAFT_10402 [Aulographum hederae CBS 113979]|uniref:Calcineurin-like phosphoesterase domain-containing protein n=1 Tax=Aulographum hederae CBS 113979 TaxID=1176131 RepID=A0A6G1HHA4_9PEZI|nr:hypothetical protein K402DRAFT_10402 [Aulographum hederae CBS 113979]